MAASVIGGNIPRERQGFTIVALGAFNPAIFHPLWFSKYNLIREEEAEEAKVEIITKDAAVFKTDWFLLQVIQERFSISSNDPTKDRPLRDLVLGTFKILEHTPINAFGLNADQHYGMPSETEWHAFGHHYAPKKSWTGLLNDPGLRSLTMQGTREKCDAKWIWVTIEPTLTVKHGVSILVNQHYELDKNDSAKDRNMKFLKTLQTSWEDFLSYSDRVSLQLLSNYKG